MHQKLSIFNSVIVPHTPVLLIFPTIKIYRCHVTMCCKIPIMGYEKKNSSPSYIIKYM